LDLPALKRILTEPKNALVKQYVKLFDLENIKLEIEDDVIQFIAEQAHANHLGARGLRGICETILLDYMYETPGKKQKTLKITLEEAMKKWNQQKRIHSAA
jgi:ATP-dependent Clp protease ATP-binding subunit ClpX